MKNESLNLPQKERAEPSRNKKWPVGGICSGKEHYGRDVECFPFWISREWEAGCGLKRR
jgi:hypothetical protein